MHLRTGVTQRKSTRKIVIASVLALAMVAINAADLLNLAAASGAVLYCYLVIGILTVQEARYIEDCLSLTRISFLRLRINIILIGGVSSSTSGR